MYFSLVEMMKVEEADEVYDCSTSWMKAVLAISRMLEISIQDPHPTCKPLRQFVGCHFIFLPSFSSLTTQTP